MNTTLSQNVLLGVCGSIAAYKAAILTRLLVKAQHQVQVVMTQAASAFIGVDTMQVLSGRKVFVHGDGINEEGKILHISLGQWADQILIAPASASFVARLAHGMADDLLSSICLAGNKKIAIACGMNTEMWRHPATQENITRLKSWGHVLLGPTSGEQACGTTGQGRMIEPEEIITQLFNIPCRPQKKARILITAGPTWEAIDPVRGISNLSTGQSGYWLSELALKKGHQVRLVTGATQLSPPPAEKVIRVQSACEMKDAVMQQLDWCDLFISVAAVCDYRPAQRRDVKIAKKDHSSSIELIPNPDIIKQVSESANRPFCVGFSAQTDDDLKAAKAKLDKKNLDLIVHNNVLHYDALSLSKDACLTLISPNQKPYRFSGRRQDALAELLDEILSRWVRG